MSVPSMYFNLTALSMDFEQNKNIITLCTTIAVVLFSLALSRARLAQKQPDLVKRLEAAEAANAICVANLSALMLNLAALHKARMIRNETKRRYTDTPRNSELISATHRAEMNYKQAKENLSSYVIEATR